MPVPGGTTDFTQFILGAQSAGADSALDSRSGSRRPSRSSRQASRSVRPAVGSSLGTFSHQNVTDLGDFSDQMVFLWSYPPATVDLPVYERCGADLAASGDEALQPENLKTSPMRSWIALYALLKMIRDAKMTTFTREGITAMLAEAQDVPMLGIFGDEDWTPSVDHPGIFKRAGTNHFAVYRWDTDAKGPGVEGNFVEQSTMSFDDVLCGSIFGAPAEDC